MRVVIQKVSEASVQINGALCGSIQKGLLIFVGITLNDEESDVEYLCNKIIRLRIFEDEHHKMNLSLKDIHGSMLVISQFTLYANTSKGNRPSFVQAARPETAKPLYDLFIARLGILSGSSIQSGIFGANMKVSLLNDGPVTIIIDSKEKNSL